MIICIVGPTGVGKTKLSIELAKKYNGIIVNCDAMQVYKELNIGTAKPTVEEREGIPHYLLDFVPVEDNYTVFDYQKDARKIIEEHKGENIIFVGGTGLYLKSVLYDYRFPIEENENETYDDYTNEQLYEMVLKKDKNSLIHKNNRKRMIRFLNKKDTDTIEAKELYKAIYVGLTTDRDNLYKRINDRVDEMVNNGLIEEVKYFYDKNIRCKSINTGIGYKELYEYFDGLITKEEALDLIKKKSRNYAKRQYTFFNNQLNVKWFETDYNNFNNTIKEVDKYIKTTNNN